MLHFLIGVAICIWIVERVTHFMHERRHRKLVARMLRTSSLEPVTQRPPIMARPGLVLAVCGVVFTVVVAIGNYTPTAPAVRAAPVPYTGWICPYPAAQCPPGTGERGYAPAP